MTPIFWQASYEAFGTRTQEQGATQDRQKANTKEEDPTGLLNEGMRYRDLETGTFITRDPAGFVDGPNLYAYVRQNPWTSFDPEGLESVSEKLAQEALRAAGKEAAAGTALSASGYFVAGASVATASAGMGYLWIKRANNIMQYGDPYGPKAGQHRGAAVGNWHHNEGSASEPEPQPAPSPSSDGAMSGGGRKTPWNTARTNVESPNDELRNSVQGSYINPLTNQKVVTNEKLAADHIIPQDVIKAMPGFSNLTPEQQAQVLNNPQNIQGLPKAFNSSKGAKLPADWTTFKGQALHPDYIKRNRRLQKELMPKLQDQINQLNDANKR